MAKKKSDTDKAPKLIYVGRVAIEKGLEDFLRADTPGIKIVIGDGPDRKMLEARYPKVQFRGYKFGEELVTQLSACDIFVFPSRADTFGLVMLEAMACGLPVAAYPVPGPIDVVEHGVSGWLDNDLPTAIQSALTLDPQNAVLRASKFTWQTTAQIFCENLVPTTELNARAMMPIQYYELKCNEKS